MVLLNLMMAKIVSFIFQKYKAMASKPSTKAKPWNLKDHGAKGTTSLKSCSQINLFQLSTSGRVFTLPV